MKTITTLLLSLAALTAMVATASASSGQLALFQDDRQLLTRGDGVRAATLAELQALGVDAIKFQLIWSSVAPEGKTKPPGFDGSDPADYPSAGWAHYDALIRDAQARGFRVMVALSPPVPGWATRARGDRVGVDRPDPREFARFVEAVGKRYPSVDLWTIWNEPNHPRFLAPQATRSRLPYAPHLYRRLVTATVAGLRRSGHGGDRILFGELLPIGKSRIFRKNTMKPIRFLREFFCLDSDWRPFRGRAAAARGCAHFRRISGVNGFAYHPYTRPNGPRGVEPSRDDATIRSFGRITRALDLAQRKGRLAGGRMSVYDTEFGFQSRPPDPFQTPLSRIPGFLSESEWISFRNPRVASYSQYTMIDDPLGGGPDRYGSWQGGLRFVDGRPKPGVYDAYRLPIFVRRLGPSGVEVWGAARPGGAGSVVQIQQRLGSGAYGDLGSAFVVSNVRGYFVRRFRLPDVSRRRFRFTYRSLTSRSVKAVRR